MTFLFWNLKGKLLQGLIADLVQEHEVDVLLLAENEIPSVDLLLALNNGQGATYIPDRGLNPKITVISRLPEGSIRPTRDYGGVSVRRLIAPLGPELHLIIAHLQSKMYGNELDQAFFCRRAAQIIDEVEKASGHYRSVIVGDLNMNPFESGVVAADAFHGVMSRRIAERQLRTVAGEERRYFYNPMWSRFGDHGLGPPGTYYYSSSHQVTYFWNIFDQVMIRPDLLKAFRDEEVKVLTKAGPTDLLTASHIPNTSIDSDHLPLLFQLHLENL